MVDHTGALFVVGPGGLGPGGVVTVGVGGTGPGTPGKIRLIAKSSVALRPPSSVTVTLNEELPNPVTRQFSNLPFMEHLVPNGFRCSIENLNLSSGVWS